VKWEINPRVVFDVEFSELDYLHDLALEVIEEINSELIDIQLEPVFGTVDFKKEQLDPTIRDNPNSIVVRLDEAFGGFAGNYASHVNFGWVDLKTSAFLGLVSGANIVGGNSRWVEAGIYYVLKNVLTHEILHALNIRHQVAPIAGGSWIGLRTRAVMNIYVVRHNFGLTETDKNALYRLYGAPCEKNRVMVEIEGKSLNVTFLPLKKKLRKIISKDWGKGLMRKYTDLVNDNAVSLGVFDNEALAYVNKGNYIIQVRGIGGYEENQTFKPDIEGGTPSLNGTYYVRYDKKLGIYELTDNVKKASKIKVNGDLGIVLGQ